MINLPLNELGELLSFFALFNMLSCKKCIKRFHLIVSHGNSSLRADALKSGEGEIECLLLQSMRRLGSSNLERSRENGIKPVILKLNARNA